MLMLSSLSNAARSVCRAVAVAARQALLALAAAADCLPASRREAVERSLTAS